MGSPMTPYCSRPVVITVFLSTTSSKLTHHILLLSLHMCYTETYPPLPPPFYAINAELIPQLIR